MENQPMTDWNSSLFDCFEDVNTCCYGFWCCPCLACTVSGRFGENNCLPLCDICSLGLCAALQIPLCAPAPAVLALRASVRNKYNIKGSICDDIAVSCCCVWCSWCQMHRELRYRKEVPVVISVQQNVVNMQPIPVMVRAQPVVMAAY